jgi:hypothetical protein
MCKGGSAERGETPDHIQRREENTQALQLRKISFRILQENATQVRDCELDVEEASDKPHRDHDRERTSEKL